MPPTPRTTVPATLGRARKGTASVTVRVAVPRVPNYLKVETATGEATLDVADLSDKDLRAIGNEWVAALLANAARRRAPGMIEDTEASPGGDDSGE